MDQMDRPIDPGEQRRRKARKLVPVAVGALVVVVLIATAVGWLRPSIKHSRIRIATVEVGEVTATLDATGLVVPEFDQVLTAPVATRVTRILKTPGAAIAPGDTIVLLDDRDPRRDVARLREQISLKDNARRIDELALARNRDDLATQKSIKELELKSFQFEVDRNRQLFEMGLITQDKVRQSETDAERVAIELEHLSVKLKYAEQDHAAAMESIERELAILATDLEEAQERLAQMVVAADRQGIVTWVVPSQGAAVAAGEAVARVADLSAYRVDATLSDVLARRLIVGLPATVRSGDTRLQGRVRKILPTVSNGIVTFEVALDEQDHVMLRPNLRVDVHAVTEHHPETLRLKRGPLVNVNGREAVFVVRDDVAVRTPIRVGLSNFEMYEIVEGLVAGDKVIISDMSDYRNMQEVKIR